MKTLGNKIVAILFILIGVLSTRIDNDLTILAITLMFGIPTFLAKENLIN